MNKKEFIYKEASGLITSFPDDAKEIFSEFVVVSVNMFYNRIDESHHVIVYYYE